MEPENPDAVGITEEERSFWAFQPIRNPKVPKDASNPVDAFLPKQHVGSNCQVIEDAEPGGVIEMGVMGAAGKMAGNAVL